MEKEAEDGRGAKKVCHRCKHVILSRGLFFGLCSFWIRCSNIGCVDQNGKQTLNRIGVGQKFSVAVSAVAVILLMFVYQAGVIHAMHGINCGTFRNRAAAQVILDSDPGTFKGLDKDHNGIACQTYKYGRQK